MLLCAWAFVSNLREARVARPLTEKPDPQLSGVSFIHIVKAMILKSDKAVCT